VGAGGERKRGEVRIGNRCADRLESRTESGRSSERMIARLRCGFSRVAASSLRPQSIQRRQRRIPTHDAMRAPNALPRPEGIGRFPPTMSFMTDGPVG
jgi:hypothetical protein